MGSDPFVGEINLFAGNFAPVGWAFCAGQLLPISQNTALFSLLGTNYGGNGVSTFALPDLRGRVPLHRGQGPGLSSYPEGAVGGTEAVQLIAQQMPAHSHPVVPATASGSTSPGALTWAPGASGGKEYCTPANAGATAGMSPSAIAFNGGGAPHNNVQPSLPLNYIIALQGVFPARP